MLVPSNIIIQLSVNVHFQNGKNLSLFQQLFCLGAPLKVRLISVNSKRYRQIIENMVFFIKYFFQIFFVHIKNRHISLDVFLKDFNVPDRDASVRSSTKI